MKRTLAAGITLAVLVVALLVGRQQQRHSPTPAAPAPESGTAEDGIERMFAAAERGDVDGYLDCFTGEERQLLDRQLADQPREEFSRSLVASIQALKGWVVAPQQAGGDAEAVVSVERIYADRMERQRYRLVRQSKTWRIATVEPAEPFQPSVPYGTPVWQPPPEDQSLNQAETDASG